MTVLFDHKVQTILPGRAHDAFGRLPVSNPTTLADYQSQYDTSPLFWEDKVVATGSATHVAASSSVTLAVAAQDDSVIRQTRTYHRYQPGKSQLILITGDFLVAGDVYIVKRSKVSGQVVDTAIAQADWNGSKLTGGTYALARGKQPTLNMAKAQIFAIDLEWLGVGSVRTGFFIDGVFNPAHTFNWANENARTYMTTANLPVRYEIRSAAGVITKRMGYFDDDNGIFLHQQSVGTSGSMAAICATVISEGGFEEGRGAPFAASNGVTSIGVTTRRPILSIRPKATFNSIVNRGQIIPDAVSAMASTNPAYIELVYGGALTNASFASVNTDSIAEFDVAATAITGGITIDAANIPASGNTRNAGERSVLGRLPLTLSIAGDAPKILSLVATSHQNTSNVSGVIHWTELR